MTLPTAEQVLAEPLKPETPQRSLGRVRMPNPGAQNYLMRPALRGTAYAPRNWQSKTWQMGTKAKPLIGPHGPDHSSRRGWQSQSQTSHCVRYGNTHILLLEPIVRADAWTLTNRLYEWAQENDYWPGAEPMHYGTSVDAGLQFLLHEAKVIKEYRWVVNMDDVIARLTSRAADGGGPIVVGTDWYTGMDDLDGNRKWTPDGTYRGGHCWVARGYRKWTAKRSAKILCGNSHPDNYEAEMEADGFEWIMFAQGGEGAAVTELRLAA